MRRRIRTLAAVSAISLLAAACGDEASEGADTSAAPESTGSTATTEAAPTSEAGADTTVAGGADTTVAGAEGDCAETTPVTLQLQWVTQAQFAGYYAAVDQGFYEAMCLDVTILEGAVDIVPQDVLASGDADFAISWVPKALASREAGANIVNIAQVFQRSGTLQVSFKDKNITTPADFKGKTVGNWGFGNEVFAAMTEAGLDPAADVTNVQQQFDMVALLEGEIDAAEAMTYNEYAQVLEAVNPETGELYTPDDFNVISYEEVGVGMLQDAIWADGERLSSDTAYADTATNFVAASLQGWAYCRDNVQSCVDIVLGQSPILGASHQLWQMNEVNKLIWPAEGGVGTIDQAAWDRTAKIAQEAKNLDGATVLTAAPDADAFTNDVVTAAQAKLTEMGVDINGADYAPIEVTLEEGGQ
jgi:NitT/TauT family transport system substrate-binding protein